MSSLHYLKDHDLIELLGDYVLKAYLRKKQKEFDDAREFHEKNFQDCIDVNQENHYMISDVITDLQGSHPFQYPKDTFDWVISYHFKTFCLSQLCMIQLENIIFFEDCSWIPLDVSERIKIYNDAVDPYKENTKLRRCDP